MLGPDNIRSRPTWLRGPAFIEGDEIVLAGNIAERYAAFEPEHAMRLLVDLGNLGKLGKIVEVEDPDARLMDCIRITDKDRALKFAQEHGFLWHGPQQVGGDEIRESLKDWFIAGMEVAISGATYSAIKQSQEKDSAEPLRSYLRTLRDARWFHHLSFPDNDNDLLEWASIQLAEKISCGMTDCTPTFFTGSARDKNGESVSGFREFGFGNDPGSLVGAANYQLASLVGRKKIVRNCEECGEMFVPEDPRHRYHKKCGDRKRQRESRQRRKPR